MGAESPPWDLSWRVSTLFIIATVAMGLFTDLFICGLVSILPFILHDWVDLPEKKGTKLCQCYVGCLCWASVIFFLLAGIIADKLDTRQVQFLCVLAALLAATLMLAFGQSIPVLIIVRVPQVTSSAFVWTTGLAIVFDTVGPSHLGKTIGSASLLRRTL